jgi:hypothetical protein
MRRKCGPQEDERIGWGKKIGHLHKGKNLGRLMQEVCMLEASLGYVVRQCLKK